MELARPGPILQSNICKTELFEGALLNIPTYEESGSNTIITKKLAMSQKNKDFLFNFLRKYRSNTRWALEISGEHFVKYMTV